MSSSPAKRGSALPLAAIDVVLGVALVSCVSQPATEAREHSSSAPDRAVRAARLDCAELPEGTQLVIDRVDVDECPLVLVFIDPPVDSGSGPAEPEPETQPETQPEPLGRWLALIQLPRTTGQPPARAQALEPLAIGPAPLACGPELATCELSGFVDARHGPILVAAERGHESEHPIQIHLGLHDAGKLAFVPSWYGPSSVVDHTRIGPAFALAPYDCAGELRLLPAPRLPEATAETTPARLMMLAGHWWIGDRGQTMPPQQPDPKREGCTPLLDPLP